ncbi:glycosyltransferase [Patulibacter sp.]|uniref:glycosyltransferase n=1 Tax=Patulibacter sp. TaxID=1912859 RepID=UPI0027184520|nr:glycosyltransferase [Patulibacter sp.]MDO9407231.1 glycosyltransferase [Patulibacter sp.]
MQTLDVLAFGPAGRKTTRIAPIRLPARPRVDVSIIVPVLDEVAHLEATVRAMLAQDFPGTLELLLIDGGSTDGSLRLLDAMAQQDPRVRVLHNPDRVVPHALNIGLRAARGRFVARMDAHTVYGSEYLRHGVARLERGDVDWVSGPPVPVGSGRWSRRVAAALGSGLGRGASDKWQSEDETDAPEEWELTTSVFAGVWRRDTLDALGGWDPDWTVNEDSEMASRLLADGGRLVCRSDMASRYSPRDSISGLARQYRSYGRFRARTFVRHPESAGPLRVATAALPLAIASAALPGRVGRLGRLATLGYGALVAAQAVRTAGVSRDAPGLAAVLATMHVTFASGFLEGLVVDGPRRRTIRSSAPEPIVRPSAVRGVWRLGEPVSAASVQFAARGERRVA